MMWNRPNELKLLMLFCTMLHITASNVCLLCWCIIYVIRYRPDHMRMEYWSALMLYDIPAVTIITPDTNTHWPYSSRSVRLTEIRCPIANGLDWNSALFWFVHFFRFCSDSLSLSAISSRTLSLRITTPKPTNIPRYPPTIPAMLYYKPIW